MSEPRTLYIVRHGETDFNLAGRMQGRTIDQPLNQTGFQQAALTARYFSALPVDFVGASSRLRAIQTAKTIASDHQLSVFTTPDIDEMHFGELEGRTYGEADAELTRLRNLWRQGQVQEGPKGGESPLEVFKRADAGVRRWLETIHFQHGVVVVHGRLIRILLSGWLGLGLERMEQIEHANAAINILKYQQGSFTAEALNITSHLQSTRTTFV
jgi:probable phosphoglycerate mutase